MHILTTQKFSTNENLLRLSELKMAFGVLFVLTFFFSSLIPSRPRALRTQFRQERSARRQPLSRNINLPAKKNTQIRMLQ